MYDEFNMVLQQLEPQGLFIVRITDLRLWMQSFFTANAKVVAVGEEVPDQFYDFIYLTFEPTTPRELVWYHTKLKPHVKQGTSLIEFGSVIQ